MSFRRLSRGNFMDALRIVVRAGNGGQGLPSHGGRGGRGGDIYCVGCEGTEFIQVKSKVPGRRYQAENGEPSIKLRLLGKDGNDLNIPVPPGVVLWNAHTKRYLGSVDADGQKVVIAKGGAGGNPRNGFQGTQGEHVNLYMELKLIADVGLVGFPNAGKSTLLRSISRARPAVAAYPFTTIKPTVGQVEFEDLRRYTVADLPGLIEGAHANLGMGHRFLRHVERTAVLLFIVDIGGFRLGPKYAGRTAFETVVLLNKELELYRDDLVTKPALLAVNKMDTYGSAGKFEELKEQLKDIRGSAEKVLHESQLSLEYIKFDDVLPISALKDPHSTHILKARVRQLLDEQTPVSDGLEDEMIQKIREANAPMYPVAPVNIDSTDDSMVGRELQKPMYATSTQRKNWTFADKAQLDTMREEANAEYIKEHQDGTAKLTANEEALLLRNWEINLRDFCRRFQPPMPRYVMGTAFHYFKRFYLHCSVMDYHPKEILVTCVFLACKVEEFNVTTEQFVDNIRGDKEKAYRIIRDNELLLIRSLNFDLNIHNPFRPMEGFFIDIKTRTDWSSEEVDALRQQADEFVDKSFRTDAIFLYAPSQIALAAVLHSCSRNGGTLDSYVMDVLLGTEEAAKHLNTLVEAVRKIKTMVRSVEAQSLSKEDIKAIEKKLDICRNKFNDPNSSEYHKNEEYDGDSD
ncbi:unnamed protein product [Cyprideis torosa]|uniref:Cyclin-H n=1 Tax=Cyprideis torosa TaxID=163714 RepID=A0A7R8WHZ3_9CRUS|nr:unnamed protein product [Cyprideis torosa]CAG0900055.1 unnamed protein product [Cyprideis torosa]